jgi:hypothetical protein
MVAVMLPLRVMLPANLLGAAVTGAVGGACYAAIFLAFAVEREERATYFAKAGRLARWRRVPAAA